MTLILSVILFFSGCALFQPRSDSGSITNLPTTAKEAMFQTLTKTNWLFTLSVVGVGAGFFAFLNGSSKGLQLMAACFVVLSLIIGLTRYSAWIAAVAMIGAGCLMVHSVLIRNKAMREIVQGVQEVRTDSSMEKVKDWSNAILDRFQSDPTRKIVKKIKATFNL